MRRVLCAGAGVLVGMVAWLPAQAATASGSATAVGLVNMAVADAGHEGSVHISVVGAGGLLGRFLLSGDAGLHAGQQLASATAPVSGQIRVIVAGGAAYVAGSDAGILINAVGLTRSAAAKAGTRWVSIPPSNALYGSAVLDVTLPSELSTVQPRGHLVALPLSTFHGQRVVGIRGSEALHHGNAESVYTSVTLYVSQAPRPLPVYATLSAPSGQTETDTFTSWGKHISVSAPAGAIPISSLHD
jgi:hypothetical protein